MGERGREGEEEGTREKRKRERGKGRKEEMGWASGGKNSRSLARLSWPRMQAGLALLGRSSLATAKPHSSLPLAVADPNFFAARCTSPACKYSTQSPPRPISDPFASPSLVRMSHVRSLRRQLTELSLPHSSFDAYFHTCLFLRLFFPQISPIQLDAFPCFGTRLPFLLPQCRSISQSTGPFTHSPTTTSITTILNPTS